jgi:hypothetical protein
VLVEAATAVVIVVAATQVVGAIVVAMVVVVVVVIVVVVVVVGVGVVVVVLKEKIKEIHLYIVYSCLQLIVIVTINCLHSYRQERLSQLPTEILQLFAKLGRAN